MREKFSDILKEVSDELELPEGDVDQDEAMRSMSELLDQLVSKLGLLTTMLRSVFYLDSMVVCDYDRLNEV